MKKPKKITDNEIYLEWKNTVWGYEDNPKKAILWVIRKARTEGIKQGWGEGKVWQLDSLMKCNTLHTDNEYKNAEKQAYAKGFVKGRKDEWEAKKKMLLSKDIINMLKEWHKKDNRNVVWIYKKAIEEVDKQ